MTPQEKAKELVEKFIPMTKDWDELNGYLINEGKAKQCALIMVYELLSNSTFLLSNGELYFWNQVITEIEKL